MKKVNLYFKFLLWAGVFSYLVFATSPFVFALPEPDIVENGEVNFDYSQAKTLTVTASDDAIVNYRSFNIGENELVRFIQPNTEAKLLNRVIGLSASDILGSFYANGIIFLVNPQGINFGSSSLVQAASLVASTHSLSNENFLSHSYIFDKELQSASSIINKGFLGTDAGGYIVLISDAIRNEGILKAGLGTVALATGDKLTLSLDSNHFISIVIDEPTKQKLEGLTSAVTNTGTIQANSGRVIVNSQTMDELFQTAVNNQGVIQASQVSINHATGEVVLLANADVENKGQIKADKITIGKANQAVPKNVRLESGSLEAGTGGITVLAKNDLTIRIDISSQAGDILLFADYDGDGNGEFHQLAGTIQAKGEGNIYLDGSGEMTLGKLSTDYGFIKIGSLRAPGGILGSPYYIHTQGDFQITEKSQEGSVAALKTSRSDLLRYSPSGKLTLEASTGRILDLTQTPILTDYLSLIANGFLVNSGSLTTHLFKNNAELYIANASFLGELITLEAEDLGKVTYLKSNNLILENSYGITADSAVIIHAKYLELISSQSGTISAPLHLEANTIQISRTQGDIEILESLGLGTSIMLRGPPDGFGAIIYSHDTNLTLEAENGSIYIGKDVLISAESLALIANQNINIVGTLEAKAGNIEVVSGESINVNKDLNTTGNTKLSADKDININANVTTDSGNLELLADADLDGVGAFKQAEGTFISTINSGDITIQSSGEGTLANINSAGSLILKQGGAPATFTQWPDSHITTIGSIYLNPGVTLNASNSLYEIGKNWLSYGNFNPQISTVKLVSTEIASVVGSNIFYNFSVTVPGKIVRFDGEKTQAILGTLTFKGDYGNLLVLESLDPTKQWSINPQRQTDIQYALIGSCINIRGPPLKAIHSSSLGNNTNLDLDPYWTGQGASLNWSDPNNWDTGTVPTAVDVVTFDGTGHNILNANPNKDSVVDASFQGAIASLTIDGYTGIITLARDLTVTGDITINSGTLKAGSYTITVGGNWAHGNGNFLAGTSNVVFYDAVKPSTITGNNTFYNFTCITLDKNLYFEAGKTQTITATMHLAGRKNADGSLDKIYLRSTQEGVLWYIDPQGVHDVYCVNAYDSYNLDPRLIVGDFIDHDGNSYNWDAIRTAKASADWNLTTTWVENVVPIAGDDVTIGNGFNVTVGTAAAACSTIQIDDGGQLTVAGYTITVSGTTIVGQGTSGILSITSATGTKTFTGAVTINNGASFTESNAAQLSFGSNVLINTGGTLTEFGAAVVGIAGDLDNDGTYTASSGVHTFSGTAKTISGTSTNTIASVAVTVTYINSGTLTVNTALSGAGTLTNTGTLNVGGTSGTCSITKLSNSGTVAITGSGAISTAAANFINTGTLNLNGSGTIAGITNGNSGIVNLASSGTITAFTNGNASTLNISALTVPTITTLTVTAAGNVVNYNGSGAQTVKAQTYLNLTLSGSGLKTMPTGTIVGNKLSIAPDAGGAKASLAAGLNLAIRALFLGGTNQVAGTWGSTISAATNKNDTYFNNTATFTGILTVAVLSPFVASVAGAWSTAATWGTYGIPTAADNVVINVAVSVGASITQTGSVTINNGGTLTVTTNNRTATIGSLTINSGGTLTCSQILTVNGATNITGTITLSGARANIFNGNITLNTGANWADTDTNSYAISGSFTNNATNGFSVSTAAYTFSGAGMTFSGATTTSIPSVAVSGIYTNTGTLTIGTALSDATGTLINSGTLNIGAACSIGSTSGGLRNSGTVAVTGSGNITTALAYFINTGTLNLGGSGTIAGITNNAGGTVNLNTSGTITSFNNATSTSTLNISTTPTIPTITTLTVSAAGNTVNYTGAGAQTVQGVAYSNLTLSGSDAKTTTGATVNGILSMEGTATTTGTIATYGSAVTLQYKGSAAQTTGIEFPATFGGSRGVIINNSSGVNLGGSVTITNGFTLTSGTFAVAGNTLTLNGPTIAGTPANLSTTSSSSLVFGGSSASVNIPSSVTALSGLTINNANGVTLNSSPTISNTLTLTSGALSIGANTLTLNGAITTTSGTLTGGASSNITFGGSGANTTLPAVTLNNLIINRSNGITMGGAVTVGGTLTLTSGTFAVAGNTLTLNGPTIAGTPANLSTTSSSSLVFGGSSASVNIPSSVTALNNLTINNANGVTLNSSPTISGTLTIASGTTFSFGTTARTVTLSGTGSNTLVNNNIIDMSGSNAAHILQIAATSIATFGTLTTGTGSTVEYTVTTGGQTINSLTYNNLTLDNSSGTDTAGGDITVNSTLNTTDGSTLDMAGYVLSANYVIRNFYNTNNYGTINGNATFHGTTYNWGATINGNAIFNDTSINYGGTINGNATFNGTSYSFFESTVTGNLTYNGGSYNDGTINGNPTFNSTSYNSGTINGNATFNSTSYNSSGTISGNLTFNGTSYNLGTITLNGTTTQTITGSATWNNLTINNTYASPDDTYDVEPTAAQTVSGTLTITHGQYSAYTGDSYGSVSIADDAHAILKPDARASISVSGNWSKGASGVFTAGSSTVTFNGTTTRTIASGGSSFNHIIFNNSLGSGVNINYTGALTIGGNVTLSNRTSIAQTDNANFSVTGTINSADATDRDLTIAAGTGNISISGTIGGTYDLASLTIDAASTVTLGSITTTGNITIGGTTAPASITTTGSINSGGITMTSADYITIGGTITTTLASSNLCLYAYGNLTVNQALSSAGNLSLYADNDADGTGTLLIGSGTVVTSTGSVYLMTGGGAAGGDTITTTATIDKCSVPTAGQTLQLTSNKGSIEVDGNITDKNYVLKLLAGNNLTVDAAKTISTSRDVYLYADNDNNGTGTLLIGSGTVVTSTANNVYLQTGGGAAGGDTITTTATIDKCSVPTAAKTLQLTSNKGSIEVDGSITDNTYNLNLYAGNNLTVDDTKTIFASYFNSSFRLYADNDANGTGTLLIIGSGTVVSSANSVYLKTGGGADGSVTITTTATVDKCSAGMVLQLNSNKGSIEVDGILSKGCNLALLAGNNLTIDDTKTISAPGVVLYADNDADGTGTLLIGSGTVVTSTGSVYLMTGGGAAGGDTITTTATIDKCSVPTAGQTLQLTSNKGSIEVDGNITDKNYVLKLLAGNNLTVDAAKTISTSRDVYLYADNDNNGTGTLLIGSGTVVTSTANNVYLQTGGGAAGGDTITTTATIDKCSVPTAGKTLQLTSNKGSIEVDGNITGKAYHLNLYAGNNLTVDAAKTISTSGNIYLSADYDALNNPDGTGTLLIGSGTVVTSTVYSVYLQTGGGAGGADTITTTATIDKCSASTGYNLQLTSNKGSIEVDGNITDKNYVLKLLAGNNLTVDAAKTISTSRDVYLSADNDANGTGTLLIGSGTVVTSIAYNVYLQTGGGDDGSVTITTTATIDKCSVPTAGKTLKLTSNKGSIEVDGNITGVYNLTLLAGNNLTVDATNTISTSNSVLSADNDANGTGTLLINGSGTVVTATAYNVYLMTGGGAAGGDTITTTATIDKVSVPTVGQTLQLTSNKGSITVDGPITLSTKIFNLYAGDDLNVNYSIFNSGYRTNLYADNDNSGGGKFIQAAGTTISKTGSGDLYIRSGATDSGGSFDTVQVASATSGANLYVTAGNGAITRADANSLLTGAIIYLYARNGIGASDAYINVVPSTSVTADSTRNSGAGSIYLNKTSGNIDISACSTASGNNTLTFNTTSSLKYKSTSDIGLQAAAGNITHSGGSAQIITAGNLQFLAGGASASVGTSGANLYINPSTALTSLTAGTGGAYLNTNNNVLTIAGDVTVTGGALQINTGSAGLTHSSGTISTVTSGAITMNGAGAYSLKLITSAGDISIGNTTAPSSIYGPSSDLFAAGTGTVTLTSAGEIGGFGRPIYISGATSLTANGASSEDTHIKMGTVSGGSGMTITNFTNNGNTATITINNGGSNSTIIYNLAGNLSLVTNSGSIVSNTTYLKASSLKMIAGGTGGIGTEGNYFQTDVDILWANAGNSIYIRNADDVIYAHATTPQGVNQDVYLVTASGTMIIGTISGNVVSLISASSILNDYDTASKITAAASSVFRANNGTVGLFANALDLYMPTGIFLTIYASTTDNINWSANLSNTYGAGGLTLNDLVYATSPDSARYIWLNGVQK